MQINTIGLDIANPAVTGAVEKGFENVAAQCFRGLRLDAFVIRW
jgi:hypothetical protein